MSVRSDGISILSARPTQVPTASVSLGHQAMMLRAWLVLSDAFAFAASFYVAYWFRFELQITTAPEIVPRPEFYPQLAAILTPLSLLVAYLFRLYDLSILLGGVWEYSRVFNACTAAVMVVILSTFFVPEFVVSRLWLVSSWLCSWLLVSLNRFVSRRLVYALRQRGFLVAPAAIVGTNEEAEALAGDLADWRSSGVHVLGFIDGRKARRNSEIPGLPTIGSTSEICAIVEKHGIRDLIVAITALDRQELIDLCERVNALHDVQLRLSSGLYELLTTRVRVRTLGAVPLVSLSRVRLDATESFAKTVLEYSLTMTALLLFWPLFVAIAVLIKLDSPGPVIYRRRVLGVSGRCFDAFKFRTMYVDGDRLLENHPDLARQLQDSHKLKDDPRITRLGRWLRRLSLDELPQLFNVLRGEMSLVGPRMITPNESQKYGRHKLNLLTVKPGITGLWQVSGRSDLSYEERVRLDMFYIRNYSVWLDLQILFVQTPPAVFKARGAY